MRESATGVGGGVFFPQKTNLTMETLLSILVGIGLAAACGFRVFVPPLIISIAAKAGHLKLAPGFEWMSSDVALIGFAVATALEITAYYVPWLDNLLDTLSTPAACVAGAVVMAAMVGDLSPFLKWTLALVAGGGAAGVVQAATVTTRAASTVTTGGLANPIVATAEAAGSVAASVLAIVAPVLAVLAVAGFGWLLWRMFRRRAPVQAVPA